MDSVIWTHDDGCGGAAMEITVRLMEEMLGRGPLVSCEAEAIAKGEGVLSDIVRVQLHWEEAGEKPSSVVLKLFNLRGVQQAAGGAELPEGMVAYLKALHNNECQFYGLWKDVKDLPVKIPRCYFYQKFSETNKHGFLVLEDLSGKGYTPKFVDLLELETLLEVAEDQARFHAWCYQNPDLWKNIFSESQASAFEAQKSGSSDQGSVGSIMERTCTAYAELHPELKELMKIVYTQKSNADTAVQKTVGDVGIPGVVVHKDCWMGNLLLSSASRHSLLATVDWQTACFGNPASDLSRLIWGSTSPQLRKEHTDTILRHYYRHLCDLLPSPPFTLEKLMESYKALTSYGMVYGVFGAAINIQTVNPIPASDPLKAEKEGRVKGLVRAALEDAKAILEF